MPLVDSVMVMSWLKHGLAADLDVVPSGYSAYVAPLHDENVSSVRASAAMPGQLALASRNDVQRDRPS